MREPADAELEATLRAGSKTFHLASLVLPRRVRYPAMALYAFCRSADDGVDDAADHASALRAVDDLRARIDRIYAGASREPIAGVVARYRIPREELDLLAEGMEWDVRGRRYESVEDVFAYADRVAGTVGAMMAHLMDRTAPAIRARARALGVAMQLTNIARDVGEDAARGRVYLPRTWLEAEGVDVERFLRAPTPEAGVRTVTKRLLDLADRRYALADEGISHLPSDCRVAIRAARLLYAEIGNVVRARDGDGVTSRAVVSLRRKLWLVVRALGSRTWRPVPLVEATP